jgi:hypothetical protein
VDAHHTFARVLEPLKHLDEVAGIGRGRLGQVFACAQLRHKAGRVDVDALAKRVGAEVDDLGDHGNVESAIDIGGKPASGVRDDTGHKCLLIMMAIRDVAILP